MFKRNACSAAALALIGTFGAVTAFAQGADAQKLERVEITGTRIKSLGAASSSPITSVTTAEINASQPVGVEELFRSLPAAMPAIGSGTNNGSGGFATIDLRGLGTNRSLVLVNGRRLVPSTLTGVVDTNAIPVALLERVDLVTGGASAVYGADAVAGVVNFVMKRNFSGLVASATYGASEEGDAKRRRADLTMGGNFDGGKGNVVLSIGTTTTDAVRQGERPWGAVSLNSVNGLGSGSATSTPAHWSVTGLGALLPSTTGLYVLDGSTGRLRASTQADEYNFNPLNYYETPLKRTQITALGRYEITPGIEAYSELFHTRSSVVLNLAPTGSFTSTYRVPIGNPFIPQAAREQICAAQSIAAANCVLGNTTEVPLIVARRFTELGPRINDFQNTLNQFTVGVRGDLPFTDWSFDAYLQRGTADQVSSRINWGSFSKVQQALRAVNTTTCITATNGCVPLNIFGAEGSLTQQMINFVNLSSVSNTSVKQNVVAASANGEIAMLKSPWAKAPVSAAVGLESREVKGGNQSDGPSQIQGEVLGTGAPTPDRSGTLKLSEAYVESIVPLLSGLPLAQAVNLELGYRHTEFKTTASSQEYGSWKAGLDWAPMRGVRVRGMQQRATRAPNVNELYAPVITGLSNLAVDPCAGNRINTGDANTAGTLSSLCRQTGVPGSQVGFVPNPSAGQINNTSGGNPNLGPEEADTTTFGIVWEPTFANNLSLTLDYYRIKIKKAVSSPTTTQVIQGCYNTTGLNPTLGYNAMCQLIVRDPLTGSMNGGPGVVTQSSNLGAYDVSGIDLGANYRLNLAGMGRVDLGLIASYVSKWDFKSLPTLPTLDCVGYYGTSCGGPTSKLRFTQRATWSMGDFSAGYVWRFIGGTEEEPGGSPYLPAFAKIKNVNYVDLNGSWQVTKNFGLSMTVNNAFGKKPPIVGNTIGTTTTNSGNTFPQWYDVIGRRYSVTATAKF
ncbi:TonB-dependent receptor domain-containing protein [Roseateles sp. LKC17W]|uniref:TonB-dependent receptor domain-containing protein n=1 Tax=Pelomonas margarita TaxID=3299031 RepID=A0ABW7FDX0_9BURK